VAGPGIERRQAAESKLVHEIGGTARILEVEQDAAVGGDP
jgi:hypothetical protein